MPIPPKILRLIKKTGYWLHSRAIRTLLTKAEKTGKKPLNEKMLEQVKRIHARAMNANYLHPKTHEREIERWAQILQNHARAIETEQGIRAIKAPVIWIGKGNGARNSKTKPNGRGKS